MPTHPIHFTDRLLRTASAVERLAMAVHLNSDSCPVLAKRQALRLYDQVQDLSQSLRETVAMARTVVKPPKARSA